MRKVTVRCEWQSVHELEVPDDTPKFRQDDLAGVLEAAEDDVTSEVAELTDWKVEDKG